MVVQQADALQTLTRRVLVAAGADARNADGVSEHLVAANLCGVDTHGIIHIPLYVDDIRASQIVPTAWPITAREGPAHALLLGQWTFGQTVARVAMETAIDKARSHGVAIVSFVQSHHIGRLGFYTEMAARAGMISMIFGGGYCRDAPRAVPFGGREKVLDTNPVAMGFPTKTDDAVMFDFATTGSSGVKVANAHRRGESVPEGCIVDREGRPTTDPEDFMNGGAFVPFGGHKGYGLMFGAEILGRIFSGGDQWADPAHGSDIFRHQGVTMVVFKTDLMAPASQYRGGVHALAEQTRTSDPAPGFDRVQVPGDPESTTRATRRCDGIPIADDVWENFVTTARSLGIDAA